MSNPAAACAFLLAKIQGDISRRAVSRRDGGSPQESEMRGEFSPRTMMQPSPPVLPRPGLCPAFRTRDCYYCRPQHIISNRNHSAIMYHDKRHIFHQSSIINVFRAVKIVKLLS